MSDERETDPVSAAGEARPASATSPTRPTAATAATPPVDRASAVGAVIRALGADPDLDDPAARQALRALVGDVLDRAFADLEPELRAATVHDVVSALADEPAWRARLGDLLRGPGR